MAETPDEMCITCNRPIRARGDATHYCDDCGDGPFCDVCFELHRAEEAALDAHIRAEAEEDEAWHLDEARQYWAEKAEPHA